jgi:hypothetical protein
VEFVPTFESHTLKVPHNYQIKYAVPSKHCVCQMTKVKAKFYRIMQNIEQIPEVVSELLETSKEEMKSSYL